MNAALLPANRDGADRQMVALRLTGRARFLLRTLAHAQGVSQAAVVETLLRYAADKGTRPQTRAAPSVAGQQNTSPG